MSTNNREFRARPDLPAAHVSPNSPEAREKHHERCRIHDANRPRDSRTETAIGDMLPCTFDDLLPFWLHLTILVRDNHLGKVERDSHIYSGLAL